MSQPTTRSPQVGGENALRLEYPMSVATFDRYADAQRAVDYLSDQRFAVENLAIVGTDLRQYERVVGRRTWGSVLAQGALSGVSTGLLVAIMIYFLGMAPSFGTALLLGIATGVVIGLVFAALGNLLTRGQRDFNSITQTFARSYEVLAEHKVAQQARELLAAMPGGSATTGALAPSVAPPAPAPAAPAAPVAPTAPGTYADPAVPAAPATYPAPDPSAAPGTPTANPSAGYVPTPAGDGVTPAPGTYSPNGSSAVGQQPPADAPTFDPRPPQH